MKILRGTIICLLVIVLLAGCVIPDTEMSVNESVELSVEESNPDTESVTEPDSSQVSEDVSDEVSGEESEEITPFAWIADLEEGKLMIPPVPTFDFDNIAKMIEWMNSDETTYTRYTYKVNKPTKTYLQFMEEYKSDNSMLRIPCLNGEPLDSSYHSMPWSYFAALTYGFPCTWLIPYVNGKEMFFRQICLTKEMQEDIDGMTAAEVIRKIAPDAPNNGNFDGKKYSDIYEREIMMSGKEVKTVWFHPRTGKRIFVRFICDGFFFEIAAEESVLTDSFWENFSTIGADEYMELINNQ